MAKMTTEEAFVKVLQTHGIENAFGIIGSAFMPISDLFPKAGITFWDVAHESNGGLIADGYTGATGKMNIKSRVANAILNPKRSAWYFYKLRTLTTKLPYVDYSKIKDGKYANDDYVTYLTRYRASIAATTFYPTLKYWENAAAGCLTFMEITEKNNGQFIGFKDNESCIFINENNYQNKFQEYLSDPDNPKWEEIAKSGRDFAMNKLNNDIAVETIVELIKKLIN